MPFNPNETCKLNTKPKRNRKLPQKDIIDADFASPGSSRLIDDLLSIRTPSQHDRALLSELWGEDTSSNGFNALPPVCIGKPRESKIASHKTAAYNAKHYKTYKDKLLETKQDASFMDLSNISLIPSLPKEKTLQFGVKQDAAFFDCTTNDFDDVLASNEQVNKDRTFGRSSLDISHTEENQRTTDNAQNELLPLDEADLSNDSKKKRVALPFEKDINPNHLDNAHTKETEDNHKENSENIGMEQSNKIDQEEKLISVTKTSQNITCIDQAGPESDSFESLGTPNVNDIQKICHQDSKEICLDQKQSISVIGGDHLDDVPTNVNSHSTAVAMNNDQDPGKDSLELDININTFNLDPKERSISQSFDVNLEILNINTNDTLSVSSATHDLSKHKESKIGNTADACTVIVANNKTIRSPSMTPDKLQDARLEVMSHQSTSSEEEDDDEALWMKGTQDYEIKDSSDDVYERIFQIMSVPNVKTHSKEVDKVTISTNSSIVQKLRSKKETKRFLRLKRSAALDWIENGRDTDNEKKMLGIKRKRQLRDKLERPFITKKRIRSRWIVE